MFRHYLITAFRIILRQKLYTLIILVGLALGLSCSTVILIMVTHEVRYDNFHEKRDNIYTVRQTFSTGDSDYTTDRSGGAYGPALKDGFDEIEEFVRIEMPGELLVSYADPESNDPQKSGTVEKKFLETTGLAVDPQIFEVFTYPMLKGNPETALLQPYSMVITEDFADKYFSTENPLGKTIRINNDFDFTVTGLVKNVPDNTSHPFDFLIPFTFLKELGHDIDRFEGNPYFTYLLMKEDAPVERISDQLPQFFAGLFDPDADFYQFLTPFKKSHIYGEAKAIAGIIMTSILAVLILLIACINFMNLSTARYLNRTKEVGIRKLVGASRGSLIRQFYGETLLMTFIALNISLLVSDLIIEWINARISSDFSLNLSDPMLIAQLAGILVLSALIAGSYPAIFLSRFKPMNVIRNLLTSGKKGATIRKVLVVTQFTFTIILILCTWMVYKQYDYIKHADLGIERDGIIMITARGELKDKYPLFKEKLLPNPDILQVTTASRVPFFIDQGEFEWGEVPDAKNDLARVSWVGYDYPELFGLKMVEGRFYSEKYETDQEEAIIINRALAKKMGWDSPVGKTFYLYQDKYTIIGIIENFSSFPITLGGEGLILPFGKTGDYIFVKSLPGKTDEMIQFVEKVHEDLNPAYPFIYQEFNDYLDPIYQGVSTISPTMLGFTLLGIFISCLGLFGLSNFTTEQRTKEIGIRKAIGSSVLQIMKLLAYENVKLILVAFAIAFPLGYLLMRGIMKNLAYKTDLTPAMFIGTAGLVLFIVILTIGFQTYKSAIRNPAGSLRHE